jgi:hypothetical protein
VNRTDLSQSKRAAVSELLSIAMLSNPATKATVYARVEILLYGKSGLWILTDASIEELMRELSLVAEPEVNRSVLRALEAHPSPDPSPRP